MVWNERMLEQRMREDDIRSESERDYARIIHSTSFRKMQSKALVLGFEETDFYRTRLTHSLEVYQVGTGIAQYLEIKYYGIKDIRSTLPDSHLIGATCLGHDLGYPPFGYAGCAALSEFMLGSGGFNKNAQTLRVLSKLDNYTVKNGLNPIRRVYLGVLKYPVNYVDIPRKSDDKNLSARSGCYYDEDSDLMDWLLSPLCNEERELFESLEIRGGEAFTVYKSLDASIVSLADEIAYSIHNFEDAIELKLIDKDKWNDFFSDKADVFRQCNLDYDEITDKLFSFQHVRKDAIGKLINKAITGAVIKEIEGFTSPLFSYNAFFQDEVGVLISCFHQLVRQSVLCNENSMHLNFKAGKIIKGLVDAYTEDPRSLMSANDYDRYVSCNHPKRFICDIVSSMTDNFASKFYEKLFIPYKGKAFYTI